MELYEKINGRDWCVSNDGTVSVCGKIICTTTGHVKMEDVRNGDALTAIGLLDKWRDKCKQKHCHISQHIKTNGISYVLPDYSNPGSYYVFTHPEVFGGNCYPEPKWDGNYCYQIIRLPIPSGAQCIIDSSPCRDEPNKISIRWWNGKTTNKKCNCCSK